MENLENHHIEELSKHNQLQVYGGKEHRLTCILSVKECLAFVDIYCPVAHHKKKPKPKPISKDFWTMRW